LETIAMDQILELLRLVETLPAVLGELLRMIRDVAYGLLPPELDIWLATNEWLLWGGLVIVALLLIVTIAGKLGGGE
jgi:hypothetical protein